MEEGVIERIILHTQKRKSVKLIAFQNKYCARSSPFAVPTNSRTHAVMSSVSRFSSSTLVKEYVVQRVLYICIYI